MNDAVKVTFKEGNSDQKEFLFKDSFTVGRSDECSIRIDHGLVSRVHLKITKQDNTWTIRDKNSSNGSFVNGSKIEFLELKNNIEVQLGKNGPILHLILQNVKEPATETKEPEPDHVKKRYNIKETEKAFKSGTDSVNEYIHHYFDESNKEIGTHTRLVREAFHVVRKKQKSRYVKIIIAVGLIAIIIGTYALIQYLKENRQIEIAENIFYNMKTLELEIASLKKSLADSRDPKIMEALKTFDERYHQLERNYEKLVDELDIYNLSAEDKLIVKTARIFGECEFAIPPGFISEVKNYIKKWQSTSRYVNAIERATANGYTQLIVNYLVRNNLPHQFFYLALQESNFIEQSVGPQTRFGYAKGIWQFIAQTAQRYGLTIGPLSDKNHYDPGDDRFNFPKATSAAVRYIKDIYNTDAQASGLLVMASYNWGEHRVINLIQKMPVNPKERNFWKFLEKHKIPDETYKYVYSIFSAAVIGEDPKLFGFNFDNPLKTALANVTIN